MRNVPRFFALPSNPAESSVEQKQIEIAALPVAEAGLRSYSSLGGWNLFINANARAPDDAYEFIRFMSTPVPLDKGLRPPDVPEELYEDEEILRKVRVAELGQEAIRNTRPAPSRCSTPTCL